MKENYEKLSRDEAVEMWLRELRGPTALKMTGKLAHPLNENARCCLGHLCAAIGAKRTIDRFDYCGETYPRVCYEGETTVLPKKVCRVLDITEKGEFVHPVRLDGYMCTFSSLVSLNDQTGLTPAQIADVIEKQIAADNFLGWGGE